MKVNEIWVSKDRNREKVRIDYVVHSKSSSTDYVGYTYLIPPKDHEQPSIEHMICRQWFVDNFQKCRK